MIKFLHENIQNYLSSLVKMGFNEVQQKYFKWQLKSMKVVQIQSYKSNEELKIEIESFIKHYKVKVKDCYTTAAKCCLYCDDVEYIEGYISYSGIPIEHAFNYYKGIYFDLTAEILFDSKMGNEHVQIVKLDKSLLSKYMTKTGYYGEMIQNFYKDKIIKEK